MKIIQIFVSKMFDLTIKNRYIKKNYENLFSIFFIPSLCLAAVFFHVLKDYFNPRFLLIATCLELGLLFIVLKRTQNFYKIQKLRKIDPSGEISEEVLSKNILKLHKALQNSFIFSKFFNKSVFFSTQIVKCANFDKNTMTKSLLSLNINMRLQSKIVYTIHNMNAAKMRACNKFSYLLLWSKSGYHIIFSKDDSDYQTILNSELIEIQF